MKAEITTKNYTVTDEGIEVTTSPSSDIALDEIQEEEKLVNVIVTKWNQLVGVTENLTIKFAKIVNDILSEYPQERKKNIITKVSKHPDLKTTLSKDRIYQGLRLLEHRPEIIDFNPNNNSDIYTKEDGQPNIEFYLTLYKWKLGNDARVRLEEEGKRNKWSVRDLQKAIYKERDIVSGDIKNIGKSDLIKRLFAIVKSLNNDSIEKLCDIAQQEIDKIQNEKERLRNNS